MKLFSYLFVIFISLFFIGCQSQPTPEEAAKQYQAEQTALKYIEKNMNNCIESKHEIYNDENINVETIANIITEECKHYYLKYMIVKMPDDINNNSISRSSYMNVVHQNQYRTVYNQVIKYVVKKRAYQKE